MSSSNTNEEEDNQVLIGRTADGITFPLPKMHSPFSYKPPTSWKWFDFVKYGCALNILLLFTAVPAPVYVILFFFWRLAYNVGIGSVLKWQSEEKWMTKRFEQLRTTAWPRRFLQHDMESDYSFDAYPDEFNAWLLFRRFVDIILANDLVCYLVFCIKYYEAPPSYFALWPLFTHTLGIALCLFAVWGKSDAYRVVGNFAWYWGDFFFLVDQELVFDRVFAIAPHPMYTLGYLFFYGCSLMTSSYTVFAVSLAAHVCQLLFLELVENPHIEKTYCSMVAADETQERRDSILYHPHTGYFRSDLIVFKNLNPFRSSDLFMLTLLGFHLILNFINLPEWFFIAEAVVFRIVHSIGLGYVLKLQSESNWWISKSMERGMSKQEAFENWKRVYNLSCVMAHVSVICCFLRYFSLELAPYRLFNVSVGAVLVFLNLWSANSVHDVLGDFGWFFGDFFIEEAPVSLKYTGVYRYFNNPEVVLGFAAHYGMAVASGSWTVFALALFGQACNWLFCRYVEQPHMRRCYGEELRSKAGVEEAVKEIVSEAVPEVKAKVDMVRQLSKRAADAVISAAGRGKEIVGNAKKENRPKND